MIFYESFKSIFNDLFFRLFSDYIHLLRGKSYEHDTDGTLKYYICQI